MHHFLKASIMTLATILSGLTLSATPASAAAACKYERFEKLLPGETMCRDGIENIIWAPGKRYVLKMQSDGNLVFYHLAEPGNQSSADRVLWVWTGGGAGAFVHMETSGVLRYKRATGTLVHSASGGVFGSWLKVQADGKLVIYSPNNVPRAQSCILTTGENRFCRV
jgi:hypothetical protein